MNSLCVTYLAAVAGAIPKITSKFKELGPSHPLPHSGVDFAVQQGTKLRAIGEGVVESLMNYGDKNVGKGVFVKLDNGVRILYGHLSTITVKAGDHVKAGDIIGLSGNTGHSTGPHLHLQAYDVSGKLIDPTNMAPAVFESVASGGLLDKVNPFKGVETQIQALNTKLDNIAYWANPVHWVTELWKLLDTLFSSGAMDLPLLIGTIGAIWLIMLGAEKPKKYLFWSWIIFWLLRAVIFA